MPHRRASFCGDEQSPVRPIRFLIGGGDILSIFFFCALMPEKENGRVIFFTIWVKLARNKAW